MPVRYVIICMVSASSEPLWTISFRYPKGVNMRSQIVGLSARAVTKMLGTLQKQSFSMRTTHSAK